ncbi:MAG: peptidyl-prolyl cis-trans isomerase [Verrucomicrobia bacterium]|nr:peptidyl-prolyl cis-trans isomerase [Verrucomicrobiota bacterium]
MMKSFQSMTGVSVALAAALFISAGCSKKTTPGDVLAHVGGRDITVADFKAEYERRAANRLPLPDRQTLLEQMIVRETLVQSAKSNGLADASDVRRACEDILIAKLKETQLDPQQAGIKVSSEEVQSAYEKEIARYTQPAKAQLAFVLIAVGAKADTNRVAATEVRATEALRLASSLPASSHGFGSVAADYSDDQVTRYRGGDAGWFIADDLLSDRWPKAVIAAGMDLKNAGEMTGVLRGPNGFYLVKKLDSRPEVITPLAQVQAAIEHRLLLAKQAEAGQKFEQQARDAANVQTDAALLATVAYPTPNPVKETAPTPPTLSSTSQ